MGIRDWLFGERVGAVEKKPRSRSREQPSAAATQPKRQYKAVDVAGTWDRAVVGDHHFPGVVDSLPFGPLKVTLRLKPNEANPFAIAAYVGNRQVGWLATDWRADDPYVAWVTRLDSAGIRPRLSGLHKLTEVRREHIINFDVPSDRDEDLQALADTLIAEHQRQR